MCQREKKVGMPSCVCVDGPRKKGDLRIEGVAIQLTTSYCDSLQMNTLIVCNMYVSGVFSSSENGKTHKM